MVAKMNEKKIKISEAKGRPMLQWVGKKPIDYVKSFPAQLVEIFAPTGKSKPMDYPNFDELKDNWQNLMFQGDNKEVLGYLLANGFRNKIDLIYIDPPFDSGANYIRKPTIKGLKKSEIKGEPISLGEQIQYFDIWNNDSYLQFMYERLMLLKEFLSTKGIIMIHADWHQSAKLKLICDEIFGEQHFLNEIIWHYFMGGKSNEFFARKHDNILIYRNTDVGKLKISLKERILPYKPNLIDENSSIREYKTKDSKTGDEKYFYISPVKQDDVWDISGVFNLGNEDLRYPTQKPEELLEQIILSSTDEKDIILDCFMGSGTTQAVAQKLNRRWIGVDINKGAIQTTAKRIQKIILEQLKEGTQKTLNQNLDPKYFSFAHYKVNDYDLQLLRTEAVELAIQHIGIQRTKTDNFFEGILGKNLVKMIDFNHPLTLLDLQLIQDELKSRPDENRNVTIVCLGKELSVDSYIEDYNKKHPINKLELIELRTDGKYGKFLIHKPTQAKTNIKRKGDKIFIEINDFISPSIVERLNDSNKLIKVKIPDFRSMIDVVLIDTNYDGKVFNIKYSDVPEKKNDFIIGTYEFNIKDKTTVAVKIIDMLGEELLITKEI